MKKGIVSIVLLFFVTLIFAQVPQGFSFQGVAFDDVGSPLDEVEISVRIEILDGDVNGVQLYAEVHDLTTSAQGLYTLSVGMGDVESGQFANIDWLADSKYIRVSIDYTEDGEYEVVGTNQFLSVPYALAAGSAPIEQLIFVRSPEYKTRLIAKNGSTYDGQGSMKYIYQWINGEPEDVFIEISGLPSNTAIYTNARGGFGLSEIIKNTSNVDTIIDGILKPSSFIGLDDPDVMIPPGVYPLELNYKIDGNILATISDTLYIYGISYEDCFSQLPTTYNLESINCDSLEYLFSNEIEIDELSLTSVSLTEVFANFNENSSLTFPQGSTCDQFTYNIDFPFVTADRFVSLLSFDFVDNELRYEFKFKDVFTDVEQNCMITYGQ